MKKTTKFSIFAAIFALVVVFFAVYDGADMFQGALRAPSDEEFVSQYSPSYDRTVYGEYQDTRNFDYKTNWIGGSGKKGRFQFDDEFSDRVNLAKKDPSSQQRIRLYPYPTELNANYWDVSQAAKNFLATKASAYKEPEWKNIGVFGMGVVSSLDVDLADSRHSVACTEGSGLYRTDDAWKTYTKLDTHLQFCLQVKIDEINPDHYVALLMAPSSVPLMGRDFIYESFDAGDTWARRKIEGVEVVFKGKISDYFGLDIARVVGDELVIAGRVNLAVGDDKLSESAVVTYTGDQVMNYFPFDKATVFPTKFKGDMGVTRVRGEIDGVEGKYLYKTNGSSWERVFDLSEEFDIELYDLKAFDFAGENAERIAVAIQHVSLDTVDYIAQSKDGGETWKYREVVEYSVNEPGFFGEVVINNNIQDLILDDNDHTYVGIFVYMHGYFESTSYGSYFHKTTKTYDVKSLTDPDGHAKKIVPKDLRIDVMSMTEINGKKIVYLPTDQGLYEFNVTDRNLKTLLTDVPLGDVKQVAYTSCPRVYGGLWHIGSYWVDAAGKVSGYTLGETSGFGAGADDGCNTPVFSPVTGYLYDGEHIDWDKTNFAADNNGLDFWPIANVYQYYDGWWYLGRMLDMVRVNLDTKVVEVFEIKTKPGDEGVRIANWHFKEQDDGELVMWALGSDYTFYRKKAEDQYWESVDSIKKSYPSDFSPLWTGFAGLLVVGEADVIVHYGKDGLFVSYDKKKTSKKVVQDPIADMVVDKCGNMYAARYAPTVKGLNSVEMNGGVLISQDNGNSFYEFGHGLESVIINDLELNDKGDELYVATYGQSIFAVKLPTCE